MEDNKEEKKPKVKEEVKTEEVKTEEVKTEEDKPIEEKSLEEEVREIEDKQFLAKKLVATEEKLTKIEELLMKILGQGGNPLINSSAVGELKQPNSKKISELDKILGGK